MICYDNCNKEVTKNHIVALIFGALLFLILMTPVLEIAGARGMLIVGVIALVLLIIWKRKVLKKK